MSAVTIFCSSSGWVSPWFIEEARSLGQELAKAGHSLIYGGTDTGMMGALAQAALQSGAHVTGVIPDLNFTQGLIQNGLKETIMVKSLAQRKSQMIALGDIILVLPGGLGTLDEVFEVLALKQAGELKKPVYLYNLLNYWDPILEVLTLMVEQRMITMPIEELISVLSSRAELIRACSEKV